MASPSTPEIIAAAEPFLLAGGDLGVLLIHGYGGSIGDYLPLAKQLHATGYTVKGVRLAGHGQGLTALAATHLDDWRESVQAAYRQLVNRCRAIVVIGGSVGGDLAIDLVAQQTSRVAGLVTINTPIRYKILNPSLLKIFGFTKWLFPYIPKIKMNAADRARDAEMGSSPAWPVSGLLETYQLIDRYVKPNLKKIKVPTLIMRSTHDSWVDPASADYLYAHLGTAAKRLAIIPSERHNPFRDQAGSKFVIDEIGGFLKSVIAVRGQL